MATLTSPRYDLESSIEVARALAFHGGAAASHTLAALLGYKSVDNGAFLSRVAAAKQFGLIEGTSDDLRVTPLAHAILEPDFPETAARARFDAFMNVPLFVAVFRSKEGQPLPPDKTGMQNMLKHQFGVGDRQAPIAAARLLDSAEQAGLFALGHNKMIKPTFGERAGAVAREPAAPSALGHAPVPRQGAHEGRLPKLIEGALDELPEGQWDEQGLSEWLSLFEMALRVVYRLPRNPGATRPAVASGAPSKRAIQPAS
jgi:hypothetical protein